MVGGQMGSPATADKPLTDKQKQFCDAYVESGYDIDEAIKLSGYNYGSGLKHAKYNIKQMLNMPHIKKYISVLSDAVNSRQMVDKQWVIEKLKNIVLENSQGQKNYSAQIRALELLGNHMGLFKNLVIENDPNADASSIVTAAWENRKKKMEGLSTIQNDLVINGGNCEGDQKGNIIELRREEAGED
jgi:hypothetical protein